MCYNPSMLDRNQVIAALEGKREKFAHFRTTRAQQQQLLDEWLPRFLAMDAATMQARLDEIGIAWPGAQPTVELDQATRLCLPFDQSWGNHRDARGWAMEILLNQTTVAVDGSQLPPNKDFSPPVGAVQIGWFVNPHAAGGHYVKQVELTVLAPDELDEDEATTENNFPSQQVNLQRFVGECEKISALMADYAEAGAGTLAGQSEKAGPLFFFDGSLVISFAGAMQAKPASGYLRAIQGMLATSQRTAMPLVGFVDSSASKDLVNLLETLMEAPGTLRLSDAALLDKLLPNWGDRSPAFACYRSDKLSHSGRAQFYPEIVFTYIRLAAGRPPARVEFPRWILDAGLAKAVINLVRAECVVGTGYPYAIETADALAVITHEDRERFYALFQQFAQSADLPFSQARKSRSKQNRR